MISKQRIILLAIIASLILMSSMVQPLVIVRSTNNKLLSPTISRETMVEGKREQFILWFMEKSSVERFLELNLDNIVILHKYKIFPALLIECSTHQLSIIKSLNIPVIIFHNKRYHLLRESTDSGEMSPTTRESSIAMGANTFWTNGYDGSGIKIAVIDTGIDPNHPDLKDKIVAMKSFVKKKYGYGIDEEDPSDGNTNVWHGTRVAGIAAGMGKRDPDLGTGVAPGALIIAAKVFPSGEETTATLAGIIAAVEWCVEQGADVINLSLGGGASYSDPLVLAVNEVIKMGVTVVIAAGNEGDVGLASMSIASPGVSPYAITVGAASVDGKSVKTLYSSIGPAIHLIAKPDVCAPTGVAAPISTESGEYYGGPEEGTSFSAPHVAGAAALVAHYLKNHGINKEYWPGIIKLVLMETADPIISGETEFYELWAGAGFVNLTTAYEYLETSNKNALGIPLGIYVLPQRIPTGHTNRSIFFPYARKVFAGMRLEFNFSIITSVSATLSISLEGNISDVINLHSSKTISITSPTSFWEFNATFADDTEGYYEGYIVFRTDFEEVKVPMAFHLVKPSQRWLFDLRHTSWTIDYKYGQYKNFYLFLEGRNISVEHWYFSSPTLNEQILSKYDLVFMPDAASYYEVLWENGTEREVQFTKFTDEEITAILNYISDGGNIILIGMTPESNNITELNKLASCFGISFKKRQVATSVEKAKTIPGHFLTANVSELPFYGVSLQVKVGASIIAMYGRYPVAAVYAGGTGGFALVLATNFLFDNWAFREAYGVDREEIEGFVSNIIELTSLQKIVNVSVSPVDPRKGDTLTINVQTSITNISGTVKDYLGSTELSFSGTGGALSASFSTKLAGEHIVTIKVFLPSSYWIHRIVYVDVAKTETEAPTIELGYANDSVIGYQSGNLSISVTITDNEELLYDEKLISISVNVSGYEIELVEKSDKKVSLNILIPEERITELLNKSASNQILMVISIRALDTNLNEAVGNFVLRVTKGMIIPDIVIIAAILVPIVIVGVIIIKKKLKK